MRRPVLLSHADVVVEVYPQVFGVASVRRVFAATHGWDYSTAAPAQETAFFGCHAGWVTGDGAVL